MEARIFRSNIGVQIQMRKDYFAVVLGDRRSKFYKSQYSLRDYENKATVIAHTNLVIWSD